MTTRKFSPGDRVYPLVTKQHPGDRGKTRYENEVGEVSHYDKTETDHVWVVFKDGSMKIFPENLLTHARMR